MKNLLIRHSSFGFRHFFNASWQLYSAIGEHAGMDGMRVSLDAAGA
jgi:hypothetical protein